MRIVHVVSGYLPHESGGVQIHVRDLCRGLRARGHAVEVFARLAGPEHPELTLIRSTWDGVRVTALTNNFTDLDRFERLYTHPVIDARFAEFLDEARPDVVNIHHLSCLSTSMIAVARARGLPVVMSLHDHWMVCPRGQRIYPDDLSVCDTLDRAKCLTCLNKLWPDLLPLPARSRLLQWLGARESSSDTLGHWEAHIARMLDLCQAYTTPSLFHRDRCVEWGLDAGRCHVVPYGLDREPLTAIARAARPVRHIGFTGTVIPSKGVHVLVEAFNRLGRVDLALHIYGPAASFHGDTGYVDRLRSLIAPGFDVRFHGAYDHDDLPRILATLDVLVVPSIWWESFCLTLREGALAGLPVVASRLGALEEAIDAGLAVGFTPGDATDLARVLATAVAGPARQSAPPAVLRVEDNAAEMERIYRRAAGEGQ